MWDIKACTVCLKTDGKLFNIDRCLLRHDYNLISGIKSSGKRGSLDYLCVHCTAYVRKSKLFRDQCQKTHFLLQELLHRNKQIKKEHIEAVNRESLNIMPVLSFLEPNSAHCESAQFQWVKHNKGATAKLNIPIAHHSMLTSNDDWDPQQSVDYKETVKSEIVIDQTESIENEDNFFDLPIAPYNDESVPVNDDHFKSSDPVVPNKKKKVKKTIDGVELDQEYAKVYPISMKEAKAVIEINKIYTNGSFRCEICSRPFHNQPRLEAHLRIHDKHASGNYHCDLCDYYYKTEYLLQVHMTDKHLYKYVCTKCPEVSFDRTSAKKHYVWMHLQKKNAQAKWYKTRPSWMDPRGGKRSRPRKNDEDSSNLVKVRRCGRKPTTLPSDFLVYTPIVHEEQYQMVLDRKLSRNYLDAKFRCEMCFRGFQLVATFEKHMRKHDPVLSGPLQCDPCKLYFKNQRQMYKHMNINHLYKYTCRMCNYVVCNRSQAHNHYKWHKKVTYPCPHCDKEFMKLSTRLTHIRIKHPSSNICNLCGHSYVSENGLYCHKKLVHTKEEIEEADCLAVIPGDPNYCEACHIQFTTSAAYVTHLGSSNKHVAVNQSIRKVVRKSRAGGREGRRGRPRAAASDVLNNGLCTPTTCEVCGVPLANDVQARKHYEAEHPGTTYLKRYMCDVCGHTTRQHANLMVHMRTHTQEKPYGCPHCERRFSMPSNRDRHLVVHTGEKRYQCQHCSRRFTQSSAVKLHIQTVHLKIPYAPWDKKNRKRRKEEPAPPPPPAPPPKLLFDAQGDYLNAYISYNDE